MHALLLALALAAAQGDDFDEGGWPEDEAGRLSLSAWGGEAFDVGTSHGGSAPVFGGEVAYAFGLGDLGVAGYGYGLKDTRTRWTPVALLRLTNRFETHRGIDATFTFGAGAGHPDHWILWYQIALGVRMNLGPLWLGGELAFEQYDLLRLLGGVGVRF